MATRAHFVKKARRDYPEDGIKKGDSYWFWGFAFVNYIYRSKTQPRPSQLTRSEFMQSYLSIGETLDADIRSATCKDDIEAAVEAAKSSIEELRDEQESKRSNMPEQLQESDTGQLLQDRYDQLDEWYNSLDGVDYSTLEDAESVDTDEKSDKEDDEEAEDALSNLKNEILGLDPGIG